MKSFASSKPEMNKRKELAELAAQVAEHLRYRQELGIETIGETAKSRASRALRSSRVDAAPSSDLRDSPSLTDLPVISSTGSESLDEIRADLGECRRCKLWKTRRNLVFGEGNPSAELMFIGEAPGADEDASGRPFVGRAGQLLTKMIEAMGLKRSDVYIANVVKSRPPENRNPEKDELDACTPFVIRQIRAIHPRLIVTLGNPATQELLETKTGISRVRGQFHDYPHLPEIKVLPTFHPAYLLRSPDKKREAWQDLQKVQAFLNDLRTPD